MAFDTVRFDGTQLRIEAIIKLTIDLKINSNPVTWNKCKNVTCVSKIFCNLCVRKDITKCRDMVRSCLVPDLINQ